MSSFALKKKAEVKTVHFLTVEYRLLGTLQNRIMRLAQTWNVHQRRGLERTMCNSFQSFLVWFRQTVRLRPKEGSGEKTDGHRDPTAR